MELSSAVTNITCEFGHEDDKYTVRIKNQTYKSSERGIKIYGRHLFRHKNHDVVVLDASFSNNLLEIIPSTLLQIFINLTELKLEKCGLKKLIPTSFKYCEKVKIMKFGIDRIEIEAGVFRMCRNLEVLEFNGNQFQRMDPFAFRGLTSLKVLKMHDCNMHTIDQPLLMPLQGLEEIHITKNSISEIPRTALQDMSNLRVMNFSNNELTAFSTAYIKSKNHLEYVDLSENNIETLDRRILEDWPNNAELDLSSNICIDKKFGKLGTNELPMFDVVEQLMDCFEDASKSSVNDESSITNDAESTTSTPSASKEKSNEEKLEVKPLETSTTVETNITTDDQNVEDMTDSPFEFAKDVNDSSTNIDETTESTTTKKIESGELYSDESSEAVSSTTQETTSTTQETTTSTTTVAETTTTMKKRRKKGKKGKTTVEDTTTTSPENETTVMAETTPTEETSTVTENSSSYDTTTENTTENENAPQLHEYEQSTCRFYVDSDKNYNCELTGVSQQLKRINVNHFEGYTNINVSGIYFRDSRLFHVPKIVAKTFPNLELLSIENTNLKVMDDEFIEECGTIKRINLRDNKIRHVERNALKACIFLEFVDLSRNPIEKIEGGIFECNPKLSVIIDKLTILPAHTKNVSSDQN